MSLIGKINKYVCAKCGQPTITVDRDEGVTPFMLGCRATPGCDGMGTSSMYRTDQSQRPTHEWYMPEEAEWRRLSKEMREHVKRGGLCIRRIAAEADPAKEPTAP